MLVWLPLEPLEQRYTEQWSRWWPAQFRQDGIEFTTIEGKKLTDTIKIGSVLDAYGTNFWKMTQLANLIEALQSGRVTSEDVLLFADLWFPGIEALQYIACLGGQRPKITGVLHAGTYDPNDFTYREGMRPWGHLLEEAWLSMFDLIFVATQYHKQLILKNHNIDSNKLMVTGLPFYPDEFTKSRKNIMKDTNLVIFPHRLDKEKNPQDFDALLRALPGMTFSKTTDHCLNKSAYYDMMAGASVAISFADQETFGYAMLEATALGCYPLVPDRLSYLEIFPRQFRFQTYQELIEKLKSKRTIEEVYEIAGIHKDRYAQAITRMSEAIYNRFITK